MPNVGDNQRFWDEEYDWEAGGEEWSDSWGDSWSQWYFCIYPRIAWLLPVGLTLEIAPGFGRWTRFLKEHTRHLVGVDLSTKCVEACRQRFKGESELEFFVNDGRSLSVVADSSVDFVFSFDSLVHAEKDVFEAYLQEIARIMKPEGVGFIHHSNLLSVLSQRIEVEDSAGRAEDMSAEVFIQFASSAGLSVISQEIIAWSDAEEMDCLSTFAYRQSALDRPLRVIKNPEFMLEAIKIKRLSKLYSLNHAKLNF
jgi:ubiquinone/menaquinone biosynthesis C-methylase UbiE